MTPQFRIVLVLMTVCLLAPGCRKKAKDKEIEVKASTIYEKLSEPAPSRYDWPWWRGTNRNGVSQTVDAPVQFGPDKNLIFKVPVPGRGHSSPTISGNLLFLTTCDEKTEVQSVLCYDKNTGDQRWKTDLHEGNLATGNLRGNSQASASVACDGERVFAVFLNHDKIWLTALDLAGEELWETEVGNFAHKFGYAPSPTIYKSFVILAGDHKDGGWIASVHRKSGNIHWRRKREGFSTYTSPIIATLDGKDQILMSGTRQVASYDPETGDENWSVKAVTEATVGSVVWNDEAVFASGGYDANGGKYPHETVAVAADGSKILWENRTKIYVPSMIVHEGYLYGITDDGRVYCWNASTGEEAWKARLRGNYWGSPVLIGHRIYIGSKEGKLNIFEANPEKFKQVASHQIANQIFTTPVPSNGRLYVRATETDDGHEEYLFCFGEKNESSNSGK